jgi:hypothetical protein
MLYISKIPAIALLFLLACQDAPKKEAKKPTEPIKLTEDGKCLYKETPEESKLKKEILAEVIKNLRNKALPNKIVHCFENEDNYKTVCHRLGFEPKDTNAVRYIAEHLAGLMDTPYKVSTEKYNGITDAVLDFPCLDDITGAPSYSFYKRDSVKVWTFVGVAALK